MTEPALQQRHFTSYSGVSLPLMLINELEESIERRVTYFTGFYDDKGQLLRLEKVVYGEIEFAHEYQYSVEGQLSRAVIMEDDEVARTVVFDAHGQPKEI